MNQITSTSKKVNTTLPAETVMRIEAHPRYNECTWADGRKCGMSDFIRQCVNFSLDHDESFQRWGRKHNILERLSIIKKESAVLYEELRQIEGREIVEVEQI